MDRFRCERALCLFEVGRRRGDQRGDPSGSIVRGMPVERFSVGVLVFLCLRKCILLLVVVVLVGVVGGGVDLPVEAAINEVSDGSLSLMEWWREIGCHLTRWAFDMFVEAANASVYQML